MRLMSGPAFAFAVGMKTLLTLTLPFVSLVFSPQTPAAVNMKDAAYYKTWIDLETGPDPALFRLRRTYHSRSLHRGLFGFGWCSDFEKSLDLKRSDQILLRDCRLKAPIRFKKKNETLYESPEKELLEIKNGLFIRTTPSQVQQKYNRLGQLISLSGSPAEHMDLTYAPDGFLKHILINQRTRLEVRPDPLRRHIQSITSSEGQRILYRYDGLNLVQVQNAWDHRYSYAYDDLHNLTEISYPDRTREVLTYDPEKDWIVQVRGRDRCLLTLRYTLRATGQSYTSTAEKRCEGKPGLSTHYEFPHGGQP